MPQAQILLIDHDTMALSPLIAWLSRRGYDARSATSLAAAETALRHYSIDLIISEWRLPDGAGTDLLQRLKQAAPRIPIIFVAQGLGKADVIEALRWGRGFDCLDKPFTDFTRLEASLTAALAPLGEASLGPARAQTPLSHLNPREQEILALLGRGMDNRMIADHVGLGEKTVRNQLTVIYEKLGVINRTQAAMVARDLGLC